MSKKEDIMPHFVEVRGCINCDTSKAMKELTGKPYGFDYELIVKCISYGCQDFGITLLTPIVDPEEVLRMVKVKKLTEQQNKNVVDYLKKINVITGEYYEKIGINIKKIIAEVEECKSKK